MSVPYQLVPCSSLEFLDLWHDVPKCTDPMVLGEHISQHMLGAIVVSDEDGATLHQLLQQLEA